MRVLGLTPIVNQTTNLPMTARVAMVSTTGRRMAEVGKGGVPGLGVVAEVGRVAHTVVEITVRQAVAIMQTVLILAEAKGAVPGAEMRDAMTAEATSVNFDSKFGNSGKAK